MKIFLKIFYINILFILICCQNNKTGNKTSSNNSSKPEDEYRGFKANGYKCREKLDGYRKKFSELNTSVISDRNMTSYFKSNNSFLMYFHSACFQECTDFMPALKFIDEYFKELNKTIENIPKLVTVDLSDDLFCIMFQQKFKDIAVPFFLLFNGAKQRFERLSGYLNANDIITFIMKYLNDEIYIINDKKLLDQFLSPQVTFETIILFNQKNIEEIKKISNRFSLILFGKCQDNKLCLEKLGNDNYKYSDLVLIRMNNNKLSDFENNAKLPYLLNGNEKIAEIIPYNFTDSLKFREFIAFNSLPIVHNITDFSCELMFSSKFNTIIYIKGKNETKTNEQISILLRKLIDTKNSNLKWGGILDPFNSIEDLHKTEIFQLEPYLFKNGHVIIQGFTDNEPRVYRSNVHQINKEKEITEKFLEDFVSEFSKGKVRPEIKSEMIPRRHPKINLHKIVAKTFDYEITYNDKKAVILCLFGADLKNNLDYEYMIDTITMKLDVFNQTLTFGFMNIDFNYMKDIPIFNKTQTPYYRFYYTNKSRGYDDFKGNYSSYEEIEEWIAVNYGKDKGEGYDYLIREYIKMINNQMKEELKEQQEKHDEMMKKNEEEKKKEEMRKKKIQEEDNIKKEEKKEEKKKETDL